MMMMNSVISVSFRPGLLILRKRNSKYRRDLRILQERPIYSNFFGIPVGKHFAGTVKSPSIASKGAPTQTTTPKPIHSILDFNTAALKGSIRVVIPAGEAKAGPPLGPILGQHQINMVEFCKEFNARTADYEPGVPIRVLIVKFKEGNQTKYDMIFRGIPTNFLIDQGVMMEDNPSSSSSSQLTQIPIENLFDIVRIKLDELKTLTPQINLEGVAGMILGTLRTRRIVIFMQSSQKQKSKQQEPEKEQNQKKQQQKQPEKIKKTQL